MKTKSFVVLALLDPATSLKISDFNNSARSKLVNAVQEERLLREDLAMDAAGLKDAYAALAQIEDKEGDIDESTNLVSTQDDGYTGYLGESRSKLVDRTEEGELYGELNLNADGPQFHGLNKVKKPDENNWYIQTGDDAEGILKSDDIVNVDKVQYLKGRSKFVKDDLPLATMQRKSQEELRAEQLEKEYKQAEEKQLKAQEATILEFGMTKAEPKKAADLNRIDSDIFSYVQLGDESNEQIMENSGKVGSRSKLVDHTKDGELYGELNLDADGPQRHLAQHQDVIGGPIVTPDIDLPNCLLQTDELEDPAPATNPFVSSPDKTKAYRHRETYGTMNDIYDTYDAQLWKPKEAAVTSLAQFRDPNPFVGSPDTTKPYRHRVTYGTMNDIYDTYDAQLWKPTEAAAVTALAQHREPNPFVGSPDKTAAYRGRETYGTMNDIYDTYDAQLWKPTEAAATSLAQYRDPNPFVGSPDTSKPYRHRVTYGTMNDIYDTYDAQLWKPTEAAVTTLAQHRGPNPFVGAPDKTQSYRPRGQGTMNDIYDTYDGQMWQPASVETGETAAALAQQSNSFIGQDGRRYFKSESIDRPLSFSQEEPVTTHKNNGKFGTYGTQDSKYDSHEAYVNSIQPVKTTVAASLAQQYMEEEPVTTHKNKGKFGTYGTQDAIIDAHEAYVNSLQPKAAEAASLLQLSSDPVCTSVGCETRWANPYEDPAWTKIRYSPLDTPLEESIQQSTASDKQAQKETGQKWTDYDTDQYAEN